MTREIGNSGYGLLTNGVVIADSNAKRLHFRANVYNNDGATVSANEDVTFFFDSATGSVVRYDTNGGYTSGVVNRVSDVTFGYIDYVGGVRLPATAAPTTDTGRIEITLTVFLPDIAGQAIKR
ncbi:MAG: hypothetical protein ABL984_10160 [Pyrinomonadaceae bacterium]